MKNTIEPVVYVPKGAKLNIKNTDEDNPTVEYEYRKKIIDKDAVKKVVGGVYGRK